MNFLQKMMFEVLSSNMEVSLFESDEEIRKKVIECGTNEAIKEFFIGLYTVEELLDVIEQTMENQGDD